MSLFRWSGILSVAFFMTLPAAAQNHQAGLSGGTAFLHGDNATSEAGASIGLSYEMIFNSVLSVGMEGTYQRISGESKILDLNSVFYGPHQYDTTFLMIGPFLRFKIPIRIVQPYLSIGAGGALWFSGKTGALHSLPTESKTLWSTDPFTSIGSGVTLQLGRSWSIDIGAKGLLFFRDDLDNVDGRYASGKWSRDDFTIQAGIAVAYRFGREAEPRRDTAPGIIHNESAPIVPSEIIPEEILPESLDTDDSDDLLQQEMNFEPDVSDADSANVSSRDETVPEPTIRIPDTVPVNPPPPSVFEPPPSILTPPQPVQPQRTARRAFLVHIASFPTRDAANNLVNTLNLSGYDTRITNVDRQEIGVWFRVYVGPYPTRTEADRAAERLIQAGLSDYVAIIELEE